MTRMIRIGKLYKIIKITRLVRMMKIINERNKLVNYFSDILKIGVGFERFLFFALIFFCVIHLVEKNFRLK